MARFLCLRGSRLRGYSGGVVAFKAQFGLFFGLVCMIAKTHEMVYNTFS